MCFMDDGITTSQKLKQENSSLREALAAASRRLTKLEDEQQCFFDEGVFDLVNSMCGRNGASEEDARYEQLRRENHELRLQLLDEQQSSRDRIQELEVQFQSFAQRVATLSTPTAAADASAVDATAAPATPSSSSVAAAAASGGGDDFRGEHGHDDAVPPTVAASTPRSVAQALAGTAAAADASSDPDPREECVSISEADPDQDSDDLLLADASHKKLRPLLVEALRRSAQLEQQGARRERIIIDLDTQTRQLERQLRAADRRNKVLEDRIARLQALAGCSFDFSPTARRSPTASSRSGAPAAPAAAAMGAAPPQGEEEEERGHGQVEAAEGADRLLASSEGEDSVLDIDETW